MKYLLDTMVWLWSVGSTEKIGNKGLEVMQNGENEIYLSVASSWEIAIKTQLGKYEMPEAPTQYIPDRLARQGMHALPITQMHALKVYDLAPHHRDPFDRILIAQALVEDMTILTADRAFAKYPVDVLWCGK